MALGSLWLVDEWNAVVVQFFTSLTSYEPIATSTKESNLIGLARRGTFEVPMIRQGRGFVDVFIDDLYSGMEKI